MKGETKRSQCIEPLDGMGDDGVAFWRSLHHPLPNKYLCEEGREKETEANWQEVSHPPKLQRVVIV